jgi:dolichol-phosphate mannosyltransferase
MTSSMLDLVVIVPSRHEASNVTAVAERVEATLAAAGIAWQLVFVDDSDDETVAVLAGLAAVSSDVRVLHRPAAARVGGLAGAIKAGLDAVDSRWVAVMDADLQHPPELLCDLLAPLQAGTAQVTVGSRFLEDAGGREGRFRPALSSVARRMVRASLPRARAVTDPLGGFFAFERWVVDGVALRAEGARFLLELLVRGRQTLVAEIPYTLAVRAGGRSKAGPDEGWRLMRQVARLKLASVPSPAPVPARAAVAVR